MSFLTRPESEILDQQPPCCIEIEENLIGSLLLDNSLIDEISQLLTVEAFYDYEFQQIYKTIMELMQDDQPLDRALLLQELKKIATIECPGNLLARAVQSVPNAIHGKYYASKILESYRLRQAREIGLDLIKLSEGRTCNAKQLVGLGVEKLTEVLEGDISNEIEPIGKEVSTLVENLLFTDNQDLPITATGIEPLDNSLNGGFLPSQFIVLAARPSIGKSMLALSIALYASKQANSVAFFSLEMSKREIAERCLSHLSGISKSGFESAVQYRGAEVNEAVSKLTDRPLFVDDTASSTVDSLVSRIRILKRKHNIKLAVIDYLQLIESTDPRQTRQQQIGKISRRLKQAAQSLDISILALSQLNREADGQRPSLKHLREAGDIEQDANVVLFLWQEQENSDNCKLTIGKNRSGQRGIEFDLRFYKAECRFEEGSRDISTEEAIQRLGDFSDWNSGQC